MAVDVYHNVLWLEVAEDDVLRVNVLERQRELGRVDHRLPLYNRYKRGSRLSSVLTTACMRLHSW